jgi:glycosyltransferase involved in cell wall biosynthesis
MNIAIISDHASPLASPGGVDCGGQNVYVAHVAAELARAGHRVDVFTRRDDPAQPPVVSAGAGLPPRMRVIHVPAGPERFVPKEELLPLMPEFCDALSACCAPRRRHGPEGADTDGYDVVHANFFMSGLAALRLRETFGTPFVITFHALGKVRRLYQGSADAFPPERAVIEDMLVAEADAVIAECPHDRDDLVEHYAADPERVEIVPCGVDLTELHRVSRGLRAEYGIGEDEFLVLHVGRLVKRKGVDNVVRGVAELRRCHGVNARLLIAGGESAQPDPALTPEIGRLMEIAEEQGIAGRVIFAGRQPRERLRHFYSAADVFVTTPWYEPFGITPLEAMACACPVVGAAVGGIRHTVADGVTGYLVPPNDPGQLAERLARLAGDPERRRVFGQAGLRRVRRHFTWRLVADELARVYRKVSMPLQPAVAERRVEL